MSDYSTLRDVAGKAGVRTDSRDALKAFLLELKAIPGMLVIHDAVAWVDNEVLRRAADRGALEGRLAAFRSPSSASAAMPEVDEAPEPPEEDELPPVPRPRFVHENTIESVREAVDEVLQGRPEPTDENEEDERERLESKLGRPRVEPEEKKPRARRVKATNAETGPTALQRQAAATLAQACRAMADMLDAMAGEAGEA